MYGWDRCALEAERFLPLSSRVEGPFCWAEDWMNRSTGSGASLAGVWLVLSLCVAACDGNGWPRQVAQGGTVERPVKVERVELGTSVNTDMRVDDATDEFLPTDHVYVSIVLEGDGSAQLTARWLYEDGRLIDESSMTVTPSATPTTEFHISQASGLPLGDYRVVILLNGQTVAVKEFEVEKRR